jgi:uncharacterized protein (DUF924 family)
VQTRRSIRWKECSSTCRCSTASPYRRLLGEAPQALRTPFEDTLKFAELHASIIRRFGRFPHRNRALRRVSTAEEVDYLRTAESFGQP